MKRIHIVIEDDKKGVVKIPLTRREVHDAMDFNHMIPGNSKEFIANLKLNKCEKSWFSIHKKLDRVIDALEEGACRNWDSKCKRFIKSKTKYYHSGRAPRWQKKK